jgi:hypothetical protein
MHNKNNTFGSLQSLFNQYVRITNRRQCILLYQYVATNSTRRHTGTQGHRNSFVQKCDHHNSAGRHFRQSNFKRKQELRWSVTHLASDSLQIWGNVKIRTTNMHHDTTILLNLKDRMGTLLGMDDHYVANWKDRLGTLPGMDDHYVANYTRLLSKSFEEIPTFKNYDTCNIVHTLSYKIRINSQHNRHCVHK